MGNLGKDEKIVSNPKWETGVKQDDIKVGDQKLETVVEWGNKWVSNPRQETGVG